jgi:hypothetical protein
MIEASWACRARGTQRLDDLPHLPSQPGARLVPLVQGVPCLDDWHILELGRQRSAAQPERLRARRARLLRHLSPRTERSDRELEFKLYASTGVGEYWIIDPQARRVEVYLLGTTGYGEAAVSGPGGRLKAQGFEFSMPVDALFA